MLWFKECPRCGGDLYHDRDIYGHYISCLQCGYYLTDSQMAELEQRLAEHSESERVQLTLAA